MTRYSIEGDSDFTIANIKYIKKITKSIEKQAENTSSSIAVGGMKTKIKAAKIALAAGCNMIITRGYKLRPISSIIQKANFSFFYSKLFFAIDTVLNSSDAFNTLYLFSSNRDPRFM